MLRRKFLMATVVMANVIVTACSDTTAPQQLATGDVSSAFSPRSGTFHVTKECSAYTGHAGDFCTITSSTLKQIEAGSRVIYASDAVGTLVDTDVVLNPPGPGNNTASGHCTIDLAMGTGECTFSGGTGKFTWFQASVAVSPLGGPNFAWDGTYSFSPRD
jgi:hypothetical protein